MNILTDILSLIKRGVFVKTASPNDVIVLGVNEQPDMTGVASPIPYRSVKLIRIKDLNINQATKVVLTAPNGGLWEVTVSDGGVLQTVLVV